jgi:hypothetical protein
MIGVDASTPRFKFAIDSLLSMAVDGERGATATRSF